MQIFQLVDLTLLEIFKQEEKCHLLFGDLETMANIVYNVCTKMVNTLTC
jgi:hypothetical protein